MAKYGFSVQVKGDFNTVIEKVTAELQNEGFGVLTDIDVQATMKKKLNIDQRPYRILGACNPQLAHQAITVDPDIGLLLPCNVVVREEESGAITVAFMDPVAVLNLVKNPAIEALASSVRDKLLSVRDTLV